MSESAGRKRNVHSVFPLHGKAQAYTPPVGGNFGRGLLASSHAGTRLPIAVFLARAQGAPPLPAPGRPGRRRYSPLHILSPKKWKTARPRGPRRFCVAMSLRWHYPHQVKGSERSLPLSRSAPLFSAEYYCIFAKDCQGDLQRPGKERMITLVKNGESAGAG